MKYAALLLSLLCTALAAMPLRALAQDSPGEATSVDASTSGTANTTAGDMAISPDNGDINPGDVITITFPNPMVPAAQIDMGNQTPPFFSTPKVDGTFLWKSQTEGEFTVSNVVAGANVHFTLDPALKDVTGTPFKVPEWSADFTTPVFSISTDTESRTNLTAQPRIPLKTTYDVLLTEVATHAWIQDRDSRAHFPVEIIQTTDGPPEANEFQVMPSDALPPNHTYDLVVEGLQESKGRQPLPYPDVFPLGDTHNLHIDWVGAFNQALDTPLIRVKFNDTIPPESLKPGMVQIVPDVPNASFVADGDEVDITGDFDLTQHYQINVSPDLLGERGYGLPREGMWHATFPPRQPSISFPGPQIYLRSSGQLHFAFEESHVPTVTWKLASIPLEKLPAVIDRLTEFNDSEKDPLTGGTIPDPKTGDDKQKQTELLVDAFKLPVVLTGTCAEANSQTDELRQVTAPLPSGGTLTGPHLIEASATLPDGRIAGGRALVFFSDYILTQKRSTTQAFLRVSKMSDAQPIAGITVRALNSDSIETARATTDANGIATFTLGALFPPKESQTQYFVAYTATGLAVGLADGSTYEAGSAGGAYTQDFTALITDRNLYRPGEEVKIKGILRDAAGTDVALPPAGTVVHWQITQGDDGKVVGEGSSPVSAAGAFEGSWQIPAKSPLGECTLAVDHRDGRAYFDIEEYRVPLFSAELDTKTEVGTTAHAQVSSIFFHGGANVGARVHWTAAWTASSDNCNTYQQIGPVLDVDNAPSQTVQGDTKLDGNGQAAITCDSPFASNAAVGASSITWHADVTSIDGQTLASGATQNFSSTPVLLAVTADEKMDKPRGVTAKITANDPDQKPVAQPVNVTADLYHVITRTVKEQVAPLVLQFHNTDEFTKVATQQAVAPSTINFSATETGRYVVAVHAAGSPITATETTVTGDEPAEMPVENETTFSLTARDRPWVPGDNAVFTVQAPFAGVAWVCIETDKILDTMLVPLSGNAARIEIPVKKEYAPNATVAVYLTKPGGDSALPAERFAVAPLNVRRPDRELNLAWDLAKTDVRPGERVSGAVLASSENKPVAGADLAVFAVDDSVLQLGGWTLPDLPGTFYPPNPHTVSSYQSLAEYIEQIDAKGPFQKGFIIGDGGEGATPNVTNLRKEFKTLAFWQGSIKTGADGRASFDFQAPDNLTAYRLVALGQTTDGRFGGDASKTVTISKPLMIDPALPRFVRDGDEVELRAVVRQSFADSTAVTAKCTTDATLEADASLTGTAARNAPLVLRFKAKIHDPDLKPIKVRFDAASTSDPSMADAVEITIPVGAPTVVRREGAAGQFTGPNFNPATVMPKDWTQGRGKYSVTVSTSSWMPAIAGIPTILDYPHGCFEQITSKLLCYSLMANLMDYLPGTEARLGIYKTIFQQGIAQMSDGLLTDGRLPYWPGGTQGNDFVTCQACWALNEAAAAGFDIPDGLTDKLADAVKKIAAGPSDSTTRAFALFVLADMKKGDDLADTANDIYLHRVDMDYDGRAMLAIAMHQLNIMPDQKLQLLREIDKTIVPTAFKPANFGSMDRTEGIVAMAMETINPPNFTPAKKAEVQKRLLHIMDSASILSTQENLWLLLAFKSMLDATPSSGLGKPQPAADTLSRNGASEAWGQLDESGSAGLTLGNAFQIAGLNGSTLTYLMQSNYTMPQLDTPRVDRGFRVERVVRNLSANARTGTTAAPFRIGDQLLVTYRIYTAKQQYYVALEDSLPAAFETVNPNLAEVGQFYTIPAPDPGDQLLEVSHSELRDRSTLLYFDDFAPGPGVYSILVRVTAAGTFRWPATQITPMYDSRFSGLSESSVCNVSAE
jgi:alpha-2-macroglobulin